MILGEAGGGGLSRHGVSIERADQSGAGWIGVVSPDGTHLSVSFDDLSGALRQLRDEGQAVGADRRLVMRRVGWARERSRVVVELEGNTVIESIPTPPDIFRRLLRASGE